MMNETSQLKAQAYADGELSPGEARTVAEWLEQDAEARALLDELRNTHTALKGNEPEWKLPESREFYWSKIQRDIRRAEPSQELVETVSVRTLWRRLLIPASAVAVLILIVVLARMPFAVPTRIAATGDLTVETLLADAGAFTYRDESEGMTLVWLSYSGGNEFTDTEPANTLQ